MAKIGGVRCPVCKGWNIDAEVSAYGAWVYTCLDCGRIFGKSEKGPGSL